MKIDISKLKIPVEVYSRVVGYYRPVSNWNPGKQDEFLDRRTYTEEEITNFIKI